MSYFTYQEHQSLAAGHGQRDDVHFQSAYNKLLELHTAVHPRLRNYNLDLHPRWQKASIIVHESAAALEPSSALVLPYFRSREQAEMVEGLMGKDQFLGGVDTYRHPVIELRLMPDSFAIELVLSRYAWWDQQNFIGKLELPHHRTTFRQILLEMDDDYRFGFWQGIELNDMHLTTAEMRHGRILDEWMDTFADGNDWLRVGRWYEPESPALHPSHLLVEVFETIKTLNKLYTFLLWTSNNNFQDFYERRQQYSRRLYA
jgi:hypothetical protein